MGNGPERSPLNEFVAGLTPKMVSDDPQIRGNDYFLWGVLAARRFRSGRQRRPVAIWVTTKLPSWMRKSVIRYAAMAGVSKVIAGPRPPECLQQAIGTYCALQEAAANAARMRKRGWEKFNGRLLAEVCGVVPGDDSPKARKLPFRFVDARRFMVRVPEFVSLANTGVTKCSGRNAVSTVTQESWIAPAGKLVIDMAIDLSASQAISPTEALDLLTGGAASGTERARQ